jgi:alpha-L-fucosidase
MPVPLPPLRIPKVDLGVEQQSDAKARWLQDAKLGLFLHWGPYAGPAKGEWHMHNAAVTPASYRGYVTDATGEQFTASAYNPSDWAQLAEDMGAKYAALTTRHHDGFALFPSAHPNAWTSAQAPLNRDLVKDYVAAVRAAGLKVGLYYSPINWRYPGYYDVTGTNCAPNPWGYTTDPAHEENARIMKNEVYQAVRELVTRYGVIDDFWWDGGWVAEQGTDADGAFFWEPGQSRDSANQWPVDAAYSENDPATGKPLGLTGLVRAHQPDIVTTSRSGWIGDYTSEEGGYVPTGPIRAGQVAEKCFSVGGAWGYAGDTAMSYRDTMNVLVNAWIRNMTCLVDVGPDRTGAVPPSQAALLRQIGAYLSIYGESVYGTRGGPWEPVEGQYGFTSNGTTFYVHLLPGCSGTSFTTPSIGDAQVSRVFDVASGTALSYTVSSGRVTVTGIDRTRHPEDSVVGITLDRSVQPADIAAGRTATADSEESGKGNTAAKAVDASTSTRWCANDGNTGHWLKVDLGSTKSITGVRIAWEHDATNYRYRVEGSTDNATWTTLSDRTATTGTGQVQVAVFSAQARYVRVTVTGLPSGVWASIRTFEVYDRPFAANAGPVKLVNRKSGKVLDVNGASTADGAVAVQWSDTVSDNQSWRLVASPSTGWCADVEGGSAVDGAEVVQRPATGGADQDWQIVGL